MKGWKSISRRGGWPIKQLAYAKMQKTCMFAQIRTPREGLCQEPSDCTILNGSARKMTTTNEIEKFWKHIRSGHRKQQRKSGGCPWSMCCLGLMSCHFGEIVSYQRENIHDTSWYLTRSEPLQTAQKQSFHVDTYSILMHFTYHKHCKHTIHGLLNIANQPYIHLQKQMLEESLAWFGRHKYVQ